VGPITSTHNRLSPAPLKLRPYGALQICLFLFFFFFFFFLLLLLLLLLLCMIYFGILQNMYNHTQTVKTGDSHLMRLFSMRTSASNDWSSLTTRPPLIRICDVIVVCGHVITHLLIDTATISTEPILSKGIRSVIRPPSAPSLGPL